jgi:hypothetical protein
MFRTPTFRLALTAALLAVPLMGCSNKEGPKLSGKLVANGQPFKVDDPGEFNMFFVSVAGVGPGKTRLIGRVNPDGTFNVNGATDHGVPPGEYKIVLVAEGRYVPGKGPVNPLGPGSPFNEENSPLRYTVKEGVNELTIDVVKKTVE